MKAYKGFNKDMTCRGFQYEEGKEYETDEAELCKTGFHACEDPIDCFAYYYPADSVYHEVEIEDNGERNDDDSKIVGKKIRIGAELSLSEIADAHVEFIMKRAITQDAKTTNTGDFSAAANTGYRSAATNTGYRSAATNTGYYSAATNTGYYSAATNTGYRSAATNTGNHSAATNTGYRSAATNTGNYSAATNTGDYSAASVSGNDSVAIASGYKSRAKASLGSAIVVAERGEWDGHTYPLVGIKAAIIDGEVLKPDTFYTLKNGEFVEVENAQ